MPRTSVKYAASGLRPDDAAPTRVRRCRGFPMRPLPDATCGSDFRPAFRNALEIKLPLLSNDNVTYLTLAPCREKARRRFQMPFVRGRV
jgi:hypothetical protein